MFMLEGYISVLLFSYSISSAVCTGKPDLFPSYSVIIEVLHNTIIL